MNRQFETPEPIELYVEIGKGKVEVRATGTTTTTLDVEGQYADEVTVSFEGNRLSVIAPKEGGGWFDDNGGDWTALVSGAQALKSGRPVGWDRRRPVRGCVGRA